MKFQKLELYDTDISFLFQRMKEDTIFVSDWENGIKELNIGKEAVLEVSSDNTLYNKYIYSRDLTELKGLICNYIKCNSNSSIHESNLMISSNASISGLLTAIYCQKNIAKKKILIIGPIYFTYIHLFLDLGFEVYNLSLDIFSNELIEFDELNRLLLEHKIGALLIINPLYRTGVSFKLDVIEKICFLSSKIDCFTIIDEAYGNFQWENKTNFCCNIPLINLALKYQNVILFDSLAKRVFANGMKSSIIYGDEKVISFLEKESVIYTGSLSYIQVSFLKYLFTSGQAKVKSIMLQSTKIARENYNFYLDIVKKWKKMKISSVNSGYFALIGIPTDKFNDTDEEKIAIELIETYNLMIVPYSRYNYCDKGYLYFSINLLMDREKIIKTLQICGEHFC